MAYTQKNINIIFLVVFLTKLFVLIMNLAKNLFFIEEKMLFIDSLNQFLKSVITVKKNDKKDFNKNLIMSAEEEEKFQ